MTKTFLPDQEIIMHAKESPLSIHISGEDKEFWHDLAIRWSWWERTRKGSGSAEPK